MSQNVPNRKQIIADVEKAHMVAQELYNDQGEPTKEDTTIYEQLHSAPIEIIEFQLANRNDIKDTQLSKEQKSITIPEYINKLAETPILAIIDFLRDRKFDYNLTEWFHVAYTNDGVCEMTLEQILVKKDANVRRSNKPPSS